MYPLTSKISLDRKVYVVISFYRGKNSNFKVEKVFYDRGYAKNYSEAFNRINSMEELVSKVVSSDIVSDNKLVAFRVIFNPVNPYDKQWVSIGHLSSDNLKFNDVWKENDSYHVDINSSTKFYALQDGKILIKEYLEGENE